MKKLKFAVGFLSLQMLVIPGICSEINFKTFELPGVVKVEYPPSFSVLSEQENRSAIDYSKKIIDAATVPPMLQFNQVAILHNAKFEKEGEYAHLNIVLMPQEVTQKVFSSAEPETLNMLRNAMAEKIQATFAQSGAQILGEFKGEKEELSNGIKCYKLTFSYKKPDGSIRIDVKRYIYTKRHTIVIGVTTSAGYFNSNKSDLERIASGIIVFDK